MSLRKYLSSLLIFFSLSLSGQIQEILPLGVAPAGAGVAFSEQWIAWDNPAAIVHTESPVLSLAYENRYFSPELSNEYVAVAVPTKYFHVAGAFNFFGFEQYHEMMVSLSVARQLGKVSLGVEIDYFTLYLSPEYGYQHALTAQIGMQAQLTDKFMLGCRVFNPTFSKITFPDSSRELPTLMQLGFSYLVMRDFTFYTQLGYELTNGLDWAVGVDYRILDTISVRSGARGADYVVPSLGVGFNVARFGLFVMTEYDFRIGMSVMSNLSYQI